MDKTCGQIISERKSSRFFSSKEVAENDILDIIDSARLAPSSKNRQLWKYYILSNAEKEQVVDLFYKKLTENNTETTGLETIRIMKEAPKVVLVFMDYKEIVANNHSLLPHFLSVGASIENALLMATEKGIQSLWVYDICVIEEELCKKFYPEGMFISALFFGYESKVYPRAKKKTLSEIVINKIGEKND